MNIMKVKEFYVKWVYKLIEKQNDKTGAITTHIRTTCLIGPAVAKGEEFVAQATSHAIKSIKDNHDRDKARKLTMARALKDLFPDSKSDRFEFWDTYRMLPKVPRWSCR